MKHDLIQRYRHIERLWVSQRWEDWVETTAPGYLFTPGLGPDRDAHATVAWSRALFQAFPDITQTVQHVVADATTAAGVTRFRATHTRTLDLGLGVPLMATGRAVDLVYVKLLDFDDGLVVRDRQVMDTVALLRALSAP
ncbi:hypothetical protein NCCNTM_14440 [Mycolicibacterium sp. NCC-Tsukiji]|nr:hypothetical protein NCCNTM_14440 [Mycolicibacterium sp. NCC-Tsukiji]